MLLTQGGERFTLSPAPAMILLVEMGIHTRPSNHNPTFQTPLVLYLVSSSRLRLLPDTVFVDVHLTL